MSQPTLDFEARSVPILPVADARNSDPDTSHMAGNANLDLKGEHRVKALLALDEGGKLSDFDLASITGVQQTSIGVRRGELCKEGLAENSGEKGKSPTGSACILWQLTERGREVARIIRERMSN